jgi:hypothetical protein
LKRAGFGRVRIPVLGKTEVNHRAVPRIA